MTGRAKVPWWFPWLIFLSVTLNLPQKSGKKKISTVGKRNTVRNSREETEDFLLPYAPRSDPLENSLRYCLNRS